MVHGYHVVLTAYGFWLPNDPRGSWSDFVGKWELVRFGQTTKGVARRSLLELTEDEHKARETARQSLAYPCVQFSGLQARGIGRGFAAACQRSGYTIWACAILPEHTHLVVARHRYKIEQVANLLKGEATRRLIEEHLHPLAQYAAAGERLPRMWSEHQWQSYLDSEEGIVNAIRYVEDNPRKEGKPAQQWTFVMSFAGLEQGAWTTYP
jgi:REP element-mobilizing transposase RayT